MVDRDSRGLDRLSDEIRAAGLEEPGVCPLDLAVADPNAFNEVAMILEREFGGLDHLVHCAAHFRGLTPLDQIDPAEWMNTVQVNLNAVWALTTACIPLLRKGSRASITIVVDDEARSESAYWGAYGVTKAALRSYARILSEEVEAMGIRVLAPDPGPMRTELRSSAYLAENPATLPEPGQAAETIVERILAA
jgi:NAD(P)-dependent dehydrogenase (short-subunit alcohol dehydrogenase family)